MNVPIQPPAPINPVITIQPVTVTAPNPEGDNQPSPLAKLPSGTVVEGFVVNRDAQNNPILRTPIGDLRVTSEVFLKTGSEVVFRVDTTHASLARIVTVDGLTPQDYSAQNTRGLTKDTITASGLPLQAAAAAGKTWGPSGAPVLQALILQPQASATSPQAALAAAQTGQIPVLAQLAQLRSGTPIRLTVLDLKLPPVPVSLNQVPDAPALNQLLPPRAPAQQAAVPNVGPQLAANAPNQAPIDRAQGPAVAHTQAAQETEKPPILTKAETLSYASAPTIAEEDAPIHAAIQRQQVNQIVRQATVNPDSLLLTSELVSAYTKPANTPQQRAQQPLVQANLPQSPATPANEKPAVVNAPPGSVTVNADVIGHDAEGANILHTPFATLKLYTAQPLPSGTTLTVSAQVETEPMLQPALPPIVAEQQMVEATKRDLAALEDAFRWLGTNHPDMMREMMQRLPHTDSKMVSSLLFFIANLKQGDVTEFFGKRATRQLELNAPGMLARLREDVGQISASLADPPLANWLMIPLPMLHGQEMHQARLYVSRDPEGEKQSGGSDKGQRFLLEVGLSELGPLQLDGFVRQREHGKSFDLVIRSNQPLPNETEQGIRAIFSTSMQVTGMAGQVIFQQGEQHFVHPERAAMGQSASGGANTILA